MNNQKNLILITGASNIIGEEFTKYYGYDQDNILFTLGRRPLKGDNTKHILVDLLQTNQIQEKVGPVLESLKDTLLDSVSIIHLAGKAKNELLGVMPIIDTNYDGIDDEMYDTQIKTFENIYTFVNQHFKQNNLFDKIKFTLVGMGSLIDKRDSDIHKSMREVNNIMRNEFEKIAQNNQNCHTIILSVSTVATESEKKYRRFADQTYWLSGHDVVDKSIETIMNRKNVYQDIPIYKYHPLYKSYFEDETNEQRIERFKREIGLI